jgi:hypothetical protein
VPAPGETRIAQALRTLRGSLAILEARGAPPPHP